MGVKKRKPEPPKTKREIRADEKSPEILAIEKDPRVAFAFDGGAKGIWVFFNDGFHYEPNMTKTQFGKFGGPGSNFIHVPSIKDVAPALKKVIKDPLTA